MQTLFHLSICCLPRFLVVKGLVLDIFTALSSAGINYKIHSHKNFYGFIGYRMIICYAKASDLWSTDLGQELQCLL